VAPGKRYGAGSSRMGVAHHGERSVFGSMLVLGRTSGIALEGAADRSGRCWSGAMKLDIVSDGQNDTLV
jgi:hypothetical protein